MTPPAPTPTFAVKLRGISPDFSQIGVKLPEKSLGTLDADALVALLEKLIAIDPLRLTESDPEVLIIGRRGRFTAQNNQGNLTLRPTGDINAVFISTTPAEVPEWLNEFDGPALVVGTEEEEEELIINYEPSSRQGLVTALMVLSLIVLGTSAYFSYQPAPLVDEEAYQSITSPEQLAAFRDHTIGHYANIDGSVEILVKDSEHLTLVQTDGPQNEIRDASAHIYLPMTDSRGRHVLFSHEIGVINVSKEDSLSYNGDIYRRIN